MISLYLYEWAEQKKKQTDFVDSKNRKKGLFVENEIRNACKMEVIEV